jgi:hypothetical protein
MAAYWSPDGSGFLKGEKYYVLANGNERIHVGEGIEDR